MTRQEALAICEGLFRYGKPGDDLAPDICRWFATSGFEQVKLDASGERSYRVGSHRLTGNPVSLELGIRLFTFVR